MKLRIDFVLILAVFLFCSSLSDLQADSIWARRNKDMRELYTDDVARKIGDILTIKIIEKSEVKNKAERDLEKITSRSTTFNGKLGFDHILPSIPGFNMSSESSNILEGTADYKDKRSFVDLVTVVVVDILPNRNLVVMGTRTRNIAGDMQTIEISGIVRPSDIAFDNTVKSEQIADFRIVTRNTGVSAPYNKPGWLGKIFDIIWPF